MLDKHDRMRQPRLRLLASCAIRLVGNQPGLTPFLGGSPMNSLFLAGLTLFLCSGSSRSREFTRPDVRRRHRL